MLYRQINPGFVTAGRISSQAFRPTPKDERLLSVYDSGLITVSDCWIHFTSQPSCRSVGVMAVTVAECAVEDLPARPDPDLFPEHAVIDFSGHTSGQVERKSKRLKENAEARGWLYQPPTPIV